MTYFDKTHQDAVNRFAKCAYDAVGMFDNDLKAQGSLPKIDAWLTSNGTKTFTENVPAWQGHVTSASLFDGRAFKDPTADTIKALGQENVKIYNTAGDWFAPNNPLAQSIANHDVTKELKIEFPKITAGWLASPDRLVGGSGHTAGLNSQETFLAKYVQADGKSYTTPVQITGADLKWSDPLQRQMLSDLKFDSPAVNRMSALTEPPWKEYYPDPPRGPSVVVSSPVRDGIGVGMPGYSGPTEPLMRTLFPTLSQSPIVTVPFGTATRPGGILFHPELEIMADESGLTAAKAEQAVAAVKGKAGGEFSFEGQKYIAVKAPGSAKLFQVMAGRFHLKHQDLSVQSTSGLDLVLGRYYDSGSAEESALGKGWTFQPFTLRVGQPAKTGKATIAFGKRPVLIDNERGAEMAYQVETPEESSLTSSGESALPQYKPVTSAYQPYLAAQTNGGYTVTFAHGLRAAFNADGRLEWMGMSESNRTDYVFEAGRLARVIAPGGSILLGYDQNGRLHEAVAPDGKRVTYVMNDSLGLAEVSGGVDGSFAFGYGDDGRVSKVELVQEGRKRSLVVENSYDSKGRMLTQKTAAGLWGFRYNDNVGMAVFTDPSGNEVAYYYDGKQQLLAYGSSRKDMTLFNYDVTGRIFQVATGELLNEPSGSERPKFKVTKMVTPEIPNPEKPAGSG